MWFEWVTLILLNIYFTSFNSALYEDDTIVISETEKIDKLVNDISSWLWSDKELGKKVWDVLDKKNPDRTLLDDEFDLKITLEKLKLDFPWNDLNKDEVIKYMEIQKEKNWTWNFYNLSSMVVCTISPTISLIGLLMIAI